MLILYDKEYKTPLARKCKRDLVIGCAGMLLFSIIPYGVFVGFWKTYDELVVCAFFTFNISSVVLYYVFNWRTLSKCRLEGNTKLECTVGSFYIAVFFIALIASSSMGLQRLEAVIFANMLYSLTHSYSLLSLIYVLSGKLTIKVKEVENCHVECGEEIDTIREETIETITKNPSPSAPELTEEHEVVVADSITQKTRSTITQCAICRLQYDENVEKRVPRILVNCGHTICHGCIEYISSHHNQQMIYCPFCQQSTIIGGNIGTMPKNVGILDLIR
ncbi:hypothetical protein B9Z55_013356 [Caenorhabditis nigoni]|nr:hypothetical protein B9Z55_013356 [Caenorhabditis nigoni]